MFTLFMRYNYYNAMIIVMTKYQNKYRIPSARLQNWDYGSNGAYFITICTQNREHFFGEIVDTKMEVNEIGYLAEKYWFEIPNHFSFVELGNFVVMPNHVHGILIIDKKTNTGNRLGCNVSESESESDNRLQYVETLHCNVSTAQNEQMASISPKSGTLSAIIRSYKSVVTKNIKLIHPNFAWQSRFHDHIIRNQQSFENIQNYIQNNPSSWKEDKFNVKL